MLECYASGTRNVFVLGFVPVKSENTVVLLARDTPVHHPTIKDLNLDLTQVGLSGREAGEQGGAGAGGGGGQVSVSGMGRFTVFVWL